MLIPSREAQLMTKPGRNHSIYRAGSFDLSSRAFRRIPVQKAWRGEGNHARVRTSTKFQITLERGADYLARLSAMGDEEHEETMFQEAAKTAWVRVFIREASERGYPIEDIVALLDEPGVTAEAAAERILSTRELKPT